jgi:histidinol dehydrogenase
MIFYVSQGKSSKSEEKKKASRILEFVAQTGDTALAAWAQSLRV